MDYSLFFTRYKDMSYEKQSAARSIAKKVWMVSDPENFLSKDTVASLFFLRGQVGKSGFFAKKSIIVEFYEWLKEQGVANDGIIEYVKSLRYDDVIQSYDIQHHYFRSLDEVLDFVSQVGVARGVVSSKCLLDYKALVILLWAGLSTEEIASLETDDLINETCSVKINGKSIHIDPKHYDVLMEFANTRVHMTVGGQERTYLPSRYVFKSSVSSEKRTQNAIRLMVKNFNDMVIGDKELSIPCLSANGVFCRVREAAKDSKKSVARIIAEEAGCNRMAAAAYAKMYQKWIEGSGVM